MRAYDDERGNRIEYDGPEIENVKIVFTGGNNLLRVAREARLGRFVAQFNCSDGIVELGRNHGVPKFAATIRIGQDSRVLIGDNVSTTATCGISATEGTTVSIGRDTMIATGVQLRADDGHPIFDVRSGKRANRSKDITIGEHVWLAYNSTVLGGVTIGSGSVIGFGSIVTKNVANNAIAAGNPAKTVRRDIAWERPHLSLVAPFYKPDASTVDRSPYWGLTEEASQPVVTAPKRSLALRVRSRIARAVNARS
ncbi:acyltransferase [Agromyces archimandritae]|uniref:Acyltransferase n=1 Tax=Agromyces archimandritae TaxID=2781962 RepID=A0A975FQU7_9MICO|nr:acyltransferase [Agromyces archimandritae]